MARLLIILLERPSVFTASQLDKLADVLINAGTLFFGSMVIPYLVPGIDKPRLLVLPLGLVISLILWSLAILMVRRMNNAF